MADGSTGSTAGARAPARRGARGLAEDKWGKGFARGRAPAQAVRVGCRQRLLGGHGAAFGTDASSAIRGQEWPHKPRRQNLRGLSPERFRRHDGCGLDWASQCPFRGMNWEKSPAALTGRSPTFTVVWVWRTRLGTTTPCNPSARRWRRSITSRPQGNVKRSNYPCCASRTGVLTFCISWLGDGSRWVCG